MSTLTQRLQWAIKGWDKPGLIPENCQAVEDYRNKRISEQEMWSILTRNACKGFTLSLEHRWTVRPRKGDTVRKGDRNGVVLYRTGEEYQVKFFDDGDVVAITEDDFLSNYSSKGGRSHWTLEDI